MWRIVACISLSIYIPQSSVYLPGRQCVENALEIVSAVKTTGNSDRKLLFIAIGGDEEALVNKITDK